MNQTYGQESETERIRGTESQQNIRIDAYGGENVERTGKGTGSQRLTPDRKSGEERTGASCALGGILDQLIDDAEKQLVRSRECIVWYREEAKEYEQKLDNLRKLKKLQQEQVTEASNQNGGDNLAE